MLEKWKPIPGYERKYLVSNTGKVRSLSWKPHVGRPSKAKELTGAPNKQSGYIEVTLMLNGKQRTHRINTLVLKAFCGARPKGYQSCHFDGNKSNNHLDNLRWDTSKGNKADNVRLGRLPKRGGNGRYLPKIVDGECRLC